MTDSQNGQPPVPPVIPPVVPPVVPPPVVPPIVPPGSAAPVPPVVPPVIPPPVPPSQSVPPVGSPLPPPVAPTPSATPPSAPGASGINSTLPGMNVPPPGAPGWVPPPKPGLVPLRPLTLGDILGASFRVLRRNPGPTLGPSLIINLGIVVLVSVVTGLITVWAISRIENAATPEDANALAAGSIAFGVVGTILVGLLTMVGTAVLQGIIMTEVARATLGEKLRFRQIWATLRGRFGALIGWGFLLAAALGVLALIAVGIFLVIGAGFAVTGTDPVLAAIGVIAFFFFAGLGGMLLMTWLWTRTIFVTPTLVLERQPVFASIRRSWALTRGRFWRTLGILVLVLLIINIASQIVATPVSMASGIIVGLLAPQGEDETTAIIATVALYLVTFLVSTAVAAIGLVVQSATAALLYIDARMRSEGLDLELARFVEARQAGIPLDDPYTPRARP